ncbi:MAG TPA: efflux RND transporter periplasmic adaptor subunit, partial [Candidatus Melainabacteria bacterium]|nr:efflux RND transporter periplasmic adaptor subunit [Candidatus Melainabacteria bacterium]
MFFKLCRSGLVAGFALSVLGGCALERSQASSVEPGNSQKSGKSSRSEILLTGDQERVAGIRTVPARLALVENTSLELSSTVEAPADSTGIVYSPVNGIVARVLVDVGDSVKAGETVALVNSPDISDAQASYLQDLARLGQSRALLKTIQTRLEISRTNEQRVEALNNEGIAAKKDVENARAATVALRSEEAAAVGALNAARAHLEAAMVKLRALGLAEPKIDYSKVFDPACPETSDKTVTSSLPIRSPVSGVVVKKGVFPGQIVGPGSSIGSNPDGRSSALMTIADLRKVWVLLEVPQSLSATVKLGKYINFRTESAPGRSFRGRVSKLAQSFNADTRTAQVRAEIDNADRILKPGMLIIASLEGEPLQSSKPAVPARALQTIDGKDVVFVKGSDHHYRLRPVACGDRSGS